MDGKSRRSKRGGSRRPAVHPRPARRGAGPDRPARDFLIVSGLAGTSRDIAARTRDGAHTYTMAGAMGGACMIGLGLALARPDRRVLVVTGDGELLTDPPAFKRNMDPSACRSRFRATLLGAA